MMEVRESVEKIVNKRFYLREKYNSHDIKDARAITTVIKQLIADNPSYTNAEDVLSENNLHKVMDQLKNQVSDKEAFKRIAKMAELLFGRKIDRAKAGII